MTDLSYNEVPNAFPDDWRDTYPRAAAPDCAECGHALDDHDDHGICQIRGCDCETEDD